MWNGDKSFERLSAYALRGRIWTDQIVFSFQSFQFFQHFIKSLIGNFRAGFDVIKVFMPLDLCSQLLDFLDDFGWLDVPFCLDRRFGFV